MIVRVPSFPEDRDGVVAGMQDFIVRMDSADRLGLSVEAAAEGLAFFLEIDGFEMWLADNGTVVGGIGLLFAPFPWDRTKTIMSEQFIWCAQHAPLQTFLLLLRKAEERYDAHGADIKEFVDLTSSPPGIEKIYRRMGLRPVQRTWMG